MTESSSLRLPVAENQARFRELVSQALAHAQTLGASDAVAEVAESCGRSVTVRNQNLDTVEQHRDRGLSITVYAGQRLGSASTSDFSSEALRETVEAAWHIARHTAQDEASGLPDTDLLAQGTPDLELHHPWDVDTQEATELALQAEQAAKDVSSQITNSEGASLDTQESHFVLGNTRGFMGGYPSTRHSIMVAPIAGEGAGMQRDYWYAAQRRWQDLPDPAQVGRYAAERALARLSARRVPTGRFPVLFEAPLALGLLGALVQATSGGALYRQASFLLDSRGSAVTASHVNVIEDPFIKHAMGSSAFDAEGVATHARDVVRDGVLQNYFLSTYTGRKLGLPTTGNAGGSHNLTLSSTLTDPSDNLDAMLRKMGTGLLVTELIGQGVNYVTGDYSRGAFGYWVENGQISYPVEEITIAGNMADMLKQIVAVGADVITRGTKSSGSILIERMAVAGQ